MQLWPESFYGLYIKWLMLNNMPKLFEMLYQLDWYRSLHESWLTDLSCQANEKLLEVGCGPGLLAVSAARRHLDVYAVEHSAKMVAAARKNTQSMTTVSISQGDVKALPYQNEQFSCVIAASLINIIKEPINALIEMKRVLSPGCKLSFLVPSQKMSHTGVSHFIQQNKLQGFSAKALRTWAFYPPKFTLSQSLELAQQIKLYNITIDKRLDGMVYTVTGNK